MSKNWRSTSTIGLFGIVLISGFTALLSFMPLDKLVNEALAKPQHLLLQVDEGQLAGDYTGQVQLTGVYNGEYSSSVTPTPVDLGTIDLAIFFFQTGSTVDGYINLAHTLVFPQANTVTMRPASASTGPGTPEPEPQPFDVGQRVQGIFDGTTLRAESEPITVQVAGQEVNRQFSLASTEIRDGGATLVGTFQETIRGSGPEPYTVVGTFTLQRPIFHTTSTPAPTGTPIP